MIRQPVPFSSDDDTVVRSKIQSKVSADALSRLEILTLHEGHAAQILHLGPYSEEPATIARLQEFIADGSGSRTGRHHEIYLNDPTSAAPEKLKTIIRQSFAVQLS